MELLGELIEKLQLPTIVEREPGTVSALNRYLSTFGLQVDQGYTLTMVSAVGEIRSEDRHEMFSLLEQYPAEREAIMGAIERYREGGSDAFRQCLDSCRNALENLAKKMAGVNDWDQAVEKLFDSKTDRKLIKELYGFLSGRGVHGGTIPTQEDADMGLKLTEDCVSWILKKTRASPTF
jgi:hypothetical protein